MYIQKRFKVGKTWWRFLWSKKLAVDDEPLDGFCDVSLKLILLNDTLKKRPRYCRRIFMHELFHAVLDEYKISGKYLTNNNEELAVDEFTRLVEKLLKVSLRSKKR